MPVQESYAQFGGFHPETAALTNVLAASGVRDPRTGVPFTEAMLFGIGGGLGAGYILFEFQQHGMKVLVLGFSHLWQYTSRYYQALCDRLGVTISLPETGSRKAAADILRDSLTNGKPAVAWVDRAHMPYLQLPDALKGHIGHIVAVCGGDGSDILVDDRAAAPFRVPEAVFADARGRVGSFKNRLLLVEKSVPVDVAGAVEAGLRACVMHLGSDSDSFSLPTIRKWGRMMTDTKNKKGWPTLFRDTRGLYSILRSMFEEIELTIGGGGLRGLYSVFLAEAADVTSRPALHDAAQQYRALAALWTRLAEEALPDDVEPLRETKSLLRQRHVVMMRGGEAWRETQPVTDALRAASARCNLDFPLDEAGIRHLFGVLQERLWEIYEAETQALAALANVVGSGERR